VAKDTLNQIKEIKKSIKVDEALKQPLLLEENK